MLTGLPLLAFLAVDYLIAPPTGSGSVDSARGIPASDGGVAEFALGGGFDRLSATGDDGAAPKSVTPTALQSLIKSAVADAASGGRSSLVTSIQEELRRVGCYAGDVDGAWSDRTKVAMKAFNASVHVSLATDRPDYILLTLLQGHSSKACARSCEGELARTGACIDRSIEARAIAPAPLPAETGAARSSGDAQASSVVVPAPILVQRSPAATTVVHVAPSQAAASPAGARRAPDVKAFGPAPVAVGEPVAREGVATSAPLPGRMAIGALDTPGGRPGEGPAASAALLATETLVTRAKPLPSPGAARPRPAFATEAGSRLSRTFSDLSRNSP
jgi:peptidoglycan hydrolase-like protein with peptidoglycan-binding domain